MGNQLALPQRQQQDYLTDMPHLVLKENLGAQSQPSQRREVGKEMLERQGEGVLLCYAPLGFSPVPVKGRR
jgi:hypothetical protein